MAKFGRSIFLAFGLFAASTSSLVLAEEAVVLGDDESLTSGIPGSGPLTDDQIKEWLENPANHEVLKVSLPLGMNLGESQIKGLEKNALTRAKIELGRQLYFDTRLSADGTVSCASCHHPQEGFFATHGHRRRHFRTEGWSQLAVQLQPNSERCSVLGRSS